jgi:hypothetical protein
MRRDRQFAAVATPTGPARRTTFASMLAGVLFAALMLTPFAGAAQPPGLSAEFTVPASNGYTLDVKSERGQLTLLAYRESSPVAHITDAGRLLPAGEGTYSSATYYAPAAGGPEAIEADLGDLGAVDVAFQPSGQTRVVHLSQKGKSTDCTFPHRIVRRLGTFTGRISFHGENGYTSLDLASAPGSVGTSPFRNCSTRRGTVPREGVFGQAGPDVFLSAAKPSAHLFFSASTLGPGAGFFAGFVELLPGGLAVIRAAQARAPGTLALYPAKHVATLRPPAPFSGAATYRRDAAHPWSGSLAVAFPGVTVPLTGPSFKARMTLSE